MNLIALFKCHDIKEGMLTVVDGGITDFIFKTMLCTLST